MSDSHGGASAAGVAHTQPTSAKTLGAASTAFPPHTIKKLPRSQFLAIEYPGIIRTGESSKSRLDAMDIDGQDGADEDEDEDEDEDDRDEEEDLDTGPLARALSSISPVPPPYNHPASALNHLSDVLYRNTRVIECRLGAGSFISAPSDGGNTQQELDPIDVYRHPIVGDIVPTNDILCKITRRVWKPVRRRSGTRPAQSGQASPAPDTLKEYQVDLLGAITNTVRFRRMADFAFQPDIAPQVPGRTPNNAQIIRNSSGGYGAEGTAARPQPAPAASTAGPGTSGQDAPDPTDTGQDQSNSNTGTVDLGGSVSILHLQSMLRRMDINAITKFRFAEPTQKYEEVVSQDAEGKAVKRSTAFMIPPPLFSRQEVPWPYHYKHSGGSQLISYPKGDGRFERRYMNTQHYRGIGPTGIVMTGLKGQVPQGPDAIHKRQLIYVDKKILARMLEMCKERPIWSKMALINQFPPEDQINLANSKFYLPQIGFIIYDSVFRDCIVRYGYDVRVHPESRFYQRMQFHFRTELAGRSGRKPSAMLLNVASTGGPKTRGAETGDRPSSSKSRLSKGKGKAKAPARPGAQAEEDGDDEEADGDDPDEDDAEDRRAAEDEDGEEEEDEGQGVPQGDDTLIVASAQHKTPRTALDAAASASTAGGAGSRRKAHLFDGVNLTAFNVVGASNYSLIDVTDPMVQDYIHVEGAINLRTSFDPKTGWYTRVAWERIKIAITARVRAVRFHPRPATRAEVEQAVLERMRALKRPAGAGVAPGEGEASWEGVSAEVMASTEARDSWPSAAVMVEEEEDSLGDGDGE
ncbi:hypothetical protein V8E36_001608 [Tilletia maclaganii]